MVHALHITTWHPWVQGMAGIFIPEQCGALSRAGIRTGLIFSRLEGLRNMSLRRLHRGFPGFVRTQDPVPTWGFAAWNVPGLRRFTPRLVERTLQHSYERYCASQGRPDILHAHVALQAGAATRQIARAEGLDYVVTEHSSEILNADLSSEAARRVRPIYSDARCVVAVSSALAARIQDICPEANIRVIGNMVPDSVFGLRTPEPPRHQGFRLLTLSNLEAGKRVHVAIDAVSRLEKRIRRHVKLDIVGGGSERMHLETLAKSRDLAVEFHGELPRTQAMCLLAQADLLVHASAFETFGIVLAEAGALGVPVVATRCGGPQDIVDVRTGLLVDVDDVNGLRNAIRSVLDDIGQWRSCRDSIAAHTFDRFHESRFAASMLDVYRGRVP